MTNFWRRPAVWVLLPATFAWLLALITRPVLWATKVGGPRRNPLGNAVGHQLLLFGLICLLVHAGVTVARDRDYDLQWKYSTSMERAIATAFLDGFVVVLLYVTAIAAWRFEAGG